VLFILNCLQSLKFLLRILVFKYLLGRDCLSSTQNKQRSTCYVFTSAQCACVQYVQSSPLLASWDNIRSLQRRTARSKASHRSCHGTIAFSLHPREAFLYVVSASSFSFSPSLRSLSFRLLLTFKTITLSHFLLFLFLVLVVFFFFVSYFSFRPSLTNPFPRLSSTFLFTLLNSRLLLLLLVFLPYLICISIVSYTISLLFLFLLRLIFLSFLSLFYLSFYFYSYCFDPLYSPSFYTIYSPSCSYPSPSPILPSSLLLSFSSPTIHLCVRTPKALAPPSHLRLAVPPPIIHVGQ
jgi:hypothetical protein